MNLSLKICYFKCEHCIAKLLIKNYGGWGKDCVTFSDFSSDRFLFLKCYFTCAFNYFTLSVLEDTLSVVLFNLFYFPTASWYITCCLLSLCGMVISDAIFSILSFYRLHNSGLLTVSHFKLQKRKRHKLPLKCGAAGLALHPDNKKLAIGAKDGTVLVWGIAEQEVLSQMQAHTVVTKVDLKTLSSG